MSAQPTSTSQVIYETVKQEGGPTTGSKSAQMHGQADTAQVAQDATHKIQTDLPLATSDDANLLKSHEARSTGQVQLPMNSIPADTQHLISANDYTSNTTAVPVPRIAPTIIAAPAPGATTTTTAPLDPAQQSRLAKEQNFQQAASDIGSKMVNNPDHVTKADADLLHSREQRAQGHTEKEGVAAQVQKLANDNAAKGMV